MTTPRGKVRYFGALRITTPDGQTEDYPRAAVVDFADSAGLEEALNSGFAEFDMDDDSVAVVITKKDTP